MNNYKWTCISIRWQMTGNTLWLMEKKKQNLTAKSLEKFFFFTKTGPVAYKHESVFDLWLCKMQTLTGSLCPDTSAHYHQFPSRVKAAADRTRDTNLQWSSSAAALTTVTFRCNTHPLPPFHGPTTQNEESLGQNGKQRLMWSSSWVSCMRENLWGSNTSESAWGQNWAMKQCGGSAGREVHCAGCIGRGSLIGSQEPSLYMINNISHVNLKKKQQQTKMLQWILPLIIPPVVH